MVAEQADPPDQPAALEVARRPLAVAVLLPARGGSRLDLRPRLLEVERRHRLQVLGLRVDLVQRLDVLVAPLAQEQPLGRQLARDHGAVG